MILFRSYATWVTIAVAAGLWATFRLVDGDTIAEASRVIALTFMVMMVPAYALTAASCYVTPGWPAPRQWAGLGAFVLCGCAGISGLLSLFYRLSGRPAWVLDIPLINSWSFGLIVFGVVYTTAPDFFGSQVRRKTKVALAGLWIASITLIAYLAVARPDLAPLAEWVERTFIEAKQ